MPDGESGSAATGPSDVRAVLYGGASLAEVARALDALPQDSVAELEEQVAYMRDLRERRARPFGPPDWLFGPRELWLLRLLDEAGKTGLAQALESAPELPPLGPWDEFRDLAVDLLLAPSTEQLAELIGSDPRTGQTELYDAVDHMERESDPAEPTGAVFKIRGRRLLWILQRSRIAGHEQALAEAPALPAQTLLQGDDPDLLRSWDTDGEGPAHDALALLQDGARRAQRYREIREPADYAVAVELLTRAAGSFPKGHIGATYARGTLADAYVDRWQESRDPQLASDAADLLAQVVSELPPDDVTWPRHIIRLAGLLLLRFEAEGDPAVLAEAVAVSDRICAEWRADLATWLTGVNFRLEALVYELATRMPSGTELDDLLDLASEAGDEAEEKAGSLAPDRMVTDNLMAIGRHCREIYESSGDSRYLSAAVEVHRTALRVPAPDAESRWYVAVELSASIIGLSNNEPDPALPEEALSLLAQALSEAPPDWQARLELLQAQAVAANRKFELTAEPQSGEFGLRTARAALALARQQGRHVSICAATVARQLMSTHERTGGTDELDEAIGLYEQAASLSPPQQRTIMLNSLGGAYIRRFGLMARIGDIDAAITAFQDAARAAQPAAAEMRNVLNNLSQALAQRFLRTRDPAFLDRAVDCLEQALLAVPDPGANRAFLLARLAATLLERSRFTGEPADLDRCLELCQAVLREEGHLHKRTRLLALASCGDALMLHHRRGGPASDLDGAIDALERALPEARTDATNGPKCLADLARAYQERHRLTGSGADAERATARYLESIASGMNLNPALALQAALRLGNWAAERGAWPEAADSYRQGLKAVERLVAIQSVRSHKESWLRDAQMLPGRAAYALACAGHVEEAVLALENGQALLLNEALGQGGPDLTRMHAQGHGALADRYARVTAQVSGMRSAEPALSGTHAEPLPATDAEQLSSSLDQVIEEIKSVSGPGLSPVSLGEIADAASDRPLIYVTYCQWGGIALLVDQAGTVTPIPLPGLSYPALRERLLAYLEGSASSRTKPDEWRAAIDEAGRWLWATVMEPLVAQGHRAVTVIPTGYLWLLPLHLAWRPADVPAGRRYAMDDMLIAFAPNARVLNQEASAGVRSILVVEQSPAASPLPYAAAEAQATLRSFGGEQRHLKGRAATRSAVLAALGNFDCLHFICHGLAVPGSPLDSGLLLSDAMLRLGDVLAARTSAGLVVLSACETAVTGLTLPDEVVGLPVGFLQAGAAGVVGSLWAVPDRSTAAVMALFYQHWREAGETPAHALRNAQRQLRDELAQAGGPQAAHPSLWGAFIYVGR
jgi:CHAT domain-containing protein